jgi:hypothetical protein
MWAASRVPLGAGNVPSSFFSCIMELLARRWWCTELRWGWCSPWLSSNSFSSMADEALLSVTSWAMLDDRYVQDKDGEEVEGEGGERRLGEEGRKG